MNSKLIIWIILSCLSIIANFFGLWALLNIALKTEFKSVFILIAAFIIILTNIMNTVLAGIFYEKAQYNQDFVDAVMIGLQPYKNKTNEMDSSNITDDSIDSSVNQDPSLRR